MEGIVVIRVPIDPRGEMDRLVPGLIEDRIGMNDEQQGSQANQGRKYPREQYFPKPRASRDALVRH